MCRYFKVSSAEKPDLIYLLLQQRDLHLLFEIFNVAAEEDFRAIRKLQKRKILFDGKQVCKQAFFAIHLIFSVSFSLFCSILLFHY